MTICGVIEVDGANAFVGQLSTGVMDFDRVPFPGEWVEYVDSGVPTYYEVMDVIHRPDRQDKRPLIVVKLPTKSVSTAWSKGGV